MPTDTPMQLGMVGLGRMGAGIVRRLMADGHRCVGYDVSADAVKAVEADGMTGSTSLQEFASRLEKPRTAWVMVPAGAITDQTIKAVAEVFEEGDVIIDGGNTHKREDDAETAPLENPQYYQYDIDTTEVAEVWRRGSVIGSWLLDLTASALFASPELTEFSGRVSDSGEGRWTSIAAIEEGVPAPVLTEALYSRFSSRGLGDFADRVLSAMRKEFGGHEEKPGG